MTYVRPATAADMPWILEQLVAFDEFFGSSRSFFPSEESAEAKLAFLIEQHVVLVAERAGELQGFIAGLLSGSFYNETVIQLTELFWWVAEAHRGSRAALVLLNAFTAVGTARAHQVIMSLEDTSPVNPETLLRRGYRPKETSFLLEVS